MPALFGSGPQKREEMALDAVAVASAIVAVCVLPFSEAVMVAA
jgi:uncharacterized protein (DUF697 family)